MAWPDLRYGQRDLPRLCVRVEPDKREYHPQNALYGADALLRDYSGLPADEPLPWAMQHALNFADPRPYAPDIETRLPVLLTASADDAAVLRPHVAGRVEPVGAAFFYMRAAFHRRHPDAARPRRGTLVFPDKSTTHNDVDYDRARFAQALASLPDEFQPVAVSVFWRDFERGTHQPFADAGLMLLTSGFPYDPEFLFRQYDACLNFRYACANDLSTSFCLAVLAGCRFFHWPTGPLVVKRGDELLRHESEPTLSLPAKQACIAASPFPPGADTAQAALAAYHAGADCVRPPAFFRALFDECRAKLQAVPPEPLRPEPGWLPDRLAPWLTRGIDADGWGRRECGFMLPAPPGRRGVRVTLFLPARPDPAWRGTMRIVRDGDAYDRVVAAGELQLHLPCRADGRAARIEFRCNDDVKLAGETRRRALRVVAIDWL